jgi:hypothetical protein
MVLAPVVMENRAMTPIRHGPGATRRTPCATSALALQLLLAACGGGGAAPVARCELDPECGPGAYCHQGTCRASAPPVAGISPPAALVSARELTFQAVVTDADPGDGVARHDWTVALADGACEAEPEPTTTGALQVVFWCAGTYDVTLVVTDLHGVPSAPVTRRVEVAPSPDPPTVTASADRGQVSHLCSGEPVACRLGLPVELRSAGADPGGGSLTYAWRARPQSPLVTAAAVTFSPSGAQPTATAAIVTPGTAIAGDWIFQVRVRNAAGLLGRASVTLSVLNRPPVISSAPITLPHAYREGTYEAAGVLTPHVTDPDGDPVVVTAAYQEPAASGCTATFEPPTRALSLSCAQAAGLIGGVDREATATVVDVNGGASEAVAPIEILNRPPVIRLASSPAATEVLLDHGNGACLGGAGTCYRAEGPHPFTGEDPDGDPVSLAGLTALVDGSATHSAGEADPGPQAGFRFSTPHAFPGEFRAPNGASPFALRGVVADPFGATATGEAPIRLGNRPPAVSAPAPFVAVHHRYAAAPGEYVATADLATFVDPDGDPLSASGDGPQGCTEFGAGASPGAVAVTCRLPYRPGAGDLPPLAQFLGSREVIARASDAWSAASAASSVSVLDRPPALTSTTGPVVATCECVCPSAALFQPARPDLLLSAVLVATPAGPAVGTCTECVLEPVSLRVDPGAADPDGDPLRLTYQGPISTETKTAVPAHGALVTDQRFPATWLVSADDGGGGAAASATVVITEVSCP